MIKVNRQRFYEIFKDDVYVSLIQKNIYERSSCPHYNIIDNRTNEIVGVYSDGSWENTFEVIIELASKEDVIAHYERILKHKEGEIESYKKVLKKLRDYKNLSPKQRAEVDKEEKEKRERRKNSSSLFTFMENDSIMPYSNKEFNIDTIMEAIKLINESTLKQTSN